MRGCCVLSLRSDSERGAGRNGTGGGPKWGLLLGVLVPLALLGLLSPLLRERFSGRDDAGGQPEPFSYTQGAGQLFRCAGSGLAAVSASEARLLDQNGKLVFRQALSFETPALFTSETGALFCDIGGAAAIRRILTALPGYSGRKGTSSPPTGTGRAGRRWSRRSRAIRRR